MDLLDDLSFIRVKFVVPFSDISIRYTYQPSNRYNTPCHQLSIIILPSIDSIIPHQEYNKAKNHLINQLPFLKIHLYPTIISLFNQPITK